MGSHHPLLTELLQDALSATILEMIPSHPSMEQSNFVSYTRFKKRTFPGGPDVVIPTRP
jgi:hypothetical protein